MEVGRPADSSRARQRCVLRLTGLKEACWETFPNDRFIPCSECVKVAEVSLGDPIDIATLQRHFSLQVMGAVAELERALIRDLTKAFLRSARAQGRIGCNPALRTGDREAIHKLRMARDETYSASSRPRPMAGCRWCAATGRPWPGMTWPGWSRPGSAKAGRWKS